MLEIAQDLHTWVVQGHDVAVATVVAVSGSAPRPLGASLAVDSDGTAIGSVSGGCVEGAVYELCRQALAEGEPMLERFGYSDDDAFAAGLTCGGVIDILVTPVRSDTPGREVYTAALAAAEAGQAVALARITDGPPDVMGRALLVQSDGWYEGGLGAGPGLDLTAAAKAHALLEAGQTGTVAIEADGSYRGQQFTLLVESSVPAPRMIVFGAIDFASALVRIGKFLGYHVTVCDARPVFTTRKRFPDADEVVVDWPHRYLESTAIDGRTVLCVLTHEAKFDIPLLQLALRLPVAYVGALGSRRTHEDRGRRLSETGVTAEELARLRSPIGLDLGGRTVEETALSIAAEIVAARRGGTGTPLTGAHIPIHHDGPLGAAAAQSGAAVS
ncbi:XdhC/CoxI family protein [Streptomyces sp. NPDC006355]|uniref:XdhC family protein n=1 Tax=Streptomyces sp. NPDC006355 TaxID=3156758 RepID=UPI0033BB5C9B